jgi:hypothetical protein
MNFKAGDKVRYIGDNDSLRGTDLTIYAYYDVVDGYFVNKPGDKANYGVYAKDLIPAHISTDSPSYQQPSDWTTYTPTLTVPQQHTISGSFVFDTPTTSSTKLSIPDNYIISPDFNYGKEWLPYEPTKKTCTCGAIKTYGSNIGPEHHSKWCDIVAEEKK